MADRNTMLKQINETSFLLDDMKLYLDTHPLDENAMEQFSDYQAKRKQLLKEYAEQFEPLACDCICLESNGSDKTQTQYPNKRHWTWSDGPIPWDLEANACAAVKGGR